MRKKLASQEGERKRFRGVFNRFGKKVNYKGYSEMTVLLTHIIDTENNEVVADHAWFSYTKGFEDAKITEGVLVEFNARVKSYKKGYINKQAGMTQKKSDYKLSHPTHVRVVKP